MSATAIIIIIIIIIRIHQLLVQSVNFLVTERHLLTGADIADANHLASSGLQVGRSCTYAHLGILNQEIELFLTIADIVLVKTVVEVVACVLCADVERSISILVTGRTLSSGVHCIVDLLFHIVAWRRDCFNWALLGL